MAETKKKTESVPLMLKMSGRNRVIERLAAPAPSRLLDSLESRCHSMLEAVESLGSNTAGPFL